LRSRLQKDEEDCALGLLISLLAVSLLADPFKEEREAEIAMKD